MLSIMKFALSSRTRPRRTTSFVLLAAALLGLSCSDDDADGGIAPAQTARGELFDLTMMTSTTGRDELEDHRDQTLEIDDLGSDPASALARVARRLRSTEPYAPGHDLRALDRMIGLASVVGLGEATHSSHEFFTMKHRLFRHLVEERGFTTFALEAAWSTGLRLNDYVLYGKGDPNEIMREEFQDSYAFWNVGEYLNLVAWMRQHNLRQRNHQVQFMGNDMGYAGPELFDRVTAYVARHCPELEREVGRLYAASQPTGGVKETLETYFSKPLAEREQMAADVQRGYELLKAQCCSDANKESAWTLQHARAIAQTGALYSYDFVDPAQLAEAMRYRDRIMAENTVWWLRQTGHRILLSAHNGHIGYEPSDPEQYPKLQGQFLREQIGADYVNIGFSFGQGSFNALDLTDPDEPIRVFTVGPMPAGSNEELLERVSHQDYYLDLRTVPGRAWLDEARPTRAIGTSWPEDPRPVNLARSFDILIHLHRVTAADLLAHD